MNSKISEIFEMLRKIHELCPDFRFCQILSNAGLTTGDGFYYTQDKAVLDLLRSHYEFLTRE
jgi:hypothetical protein